MENNVLLVNEENYVALHNHSHYSTLDGYATIDEFIEAAKANNMPGIGLTDHGTASGLYKFITRTQAAGLVPVPGIEFYVAPENPLGAKQKLPVYYGEGGKKAPKYDVSRGAYTHLTVFAYNNKGIQNLFKLTSLSWKQEHFYHKPRIDTNMLAEHSEGLIVTTGCPSSEVSRRFLLGQDEKAYEYASRLKSIFGDNLYVEIMDHKMKDEELERILVPKQIKLAKDLGLKLIATNDSHYAFKKDAAPHERILAVSTKDKMKNPPSFKGGTRFAFSTDEYYIKSYDEMVHLYPEEVAKEALANTLEIMEKCRDIKLEYNPNLRPEIEIPKGYTAPQYLQKLIHEGFQSKRGHESKEIQMESIKRIKEEFEVIHSNDFVSYFLVVHDYIDFAHKNGIGVGAGRGSVGGSEIAYVLDISNTDPIRFDLLFERFLSPGRGSTYQIDYVSGASEEISVSSKKQIYKDTCEKDKVVYVHELNPGDMVNFEDGKEVIEKIFVKVPGSAPDVDTDFHTEGRERVVQYCVEKYGEENVANIVTFGTFKAKKAFKAMATIYEIPFARSNKISSTIPGGQGAEASLSDILDPESRRYKEGEDFRKLIQGDKVLEEAVEIAQELDGRISETGVHPCGLIISNTPISDVVPTQVRQSDGKLITQWEYPELESLGLIKMDLLGLDLINTVQQTLENIELANKSAQRKSEIREVPNMKELIQGDMDDPETYKNLQEGNTVGIFQLGSPGVRELLKRAQPKEFMDIATITALYRPGPMSMDSHNEWADRKNGSKEVVYIDEELSGTPVEEILRDTAGILVFQESLMQIATRYAGMTPYESDLLRKAMGKKKMDLMASLHSKFVNGAVENGSTKKLAEKIWETMVGFAAYGFNKSHSVSYAINIYQTIYLKTHYPSEFMAALIQQGFGNPEKVQAYIQEAVRMKLRIGPVDINNSQVKMSSTGISKDNKYDIVFGFSGIKNMNNKLAEAIVEERNANGLYKSVGDFVKRISKRTQFTAAPLESLAISGAFDTFGVSRKLVAEKSKMFVNSSSKVEKGVSLFSIAGTGNDVIESIKIKGKDYDYNEMIKLEAEKIGMFVSGHPTAKLGHIARGYRPVKFSQVLDSESNEKFNVMGTITNVISKTNKAGRRNIAVLLDDGEKAYGIYLPKNVVDSIVKGEELSKAQEAKEKGSIYIPSDNEKVVAIMADETIKPIAPLKLNEPYVFKASRKGWKENANLVINDIQILQTAPDGSLPYEIKVDFNSQLKEVEKVIEKYKNKDGFYVKVHSLGGSTKLMKNRIALSIEFIMELENLIGKNNILTRNV